MQPLLGSLLQLEDALQSNSVKCVVVEHEIWHLILLDSKKYVHVYSYYNFLSIIEDDDLPFLFRGLHSLAPRWYGFCLQLGVKGLDQIEMNGTSADDRLVLALKDWLNTSDVSWRKLIEAIFRPSGGGHQVLASEVAQSFRGINFLILRRALVIPYLDDVVPMSIRLLDHMHLSVVHIHKIMW